MSRSRPTILPFFGTFTVSIPYHCDTEIEYAKINYLVKIDSLILLVNQFQRIGQHEFSF